MGKRLPSKHRDARQISQEEVCQQEYSGIAHERCATRSGFLRSSINHEDVIESGKLSCYEVTRTPNCMPCKDSMVD